MGLNRKAMAETLPVGTTDFRGVSDAMADNRAALESGPVAAIERLKKAPAKAVVDKPAYKQRDFDAEARGKVKCVMFEAALQSPAIAGLKFNDLAEFLALVEKAADAGVAYTWR